MTIDVWVLRVVLIGILLTVLFKDGDKDDKNEEK